MTWHLTSDADRYARHVLDLLIADPEANTVPLTVLDSVRAGQRFSETDPLFGWYVAGGTAIGAFSVTPPFGVLLAELPEGSEPALAAALRQRGTAVPDVFGTVDAAGRFVASWTAGTDLRTEVVMRHRLYRLDALTPPVAPPAGHPRVAMPVDLDLVMDWALRFQLEAEASDAMPQREMYQRRVELGLLWLWQDEAGEPVSLAARNVAVAGVSRIGPVYTPPRFRSRGYAAAVTAACTQDALDCGARQVVLFTDLANPTSNEIYQRLGYRPLDDRVIVRFSEGRAPR